MTASGTSGHGAELAAFVDLAPLGAVVVKSVSAEPWPGNPAPRLHPVEGGCSTASACRTPGGCVAGRASSRLWPNTGATVVASIWGFTAEQLRGGRRRHPGGPGAGRAPCAIDAVVAVEANISCPNIEDRRQMFAHSHEGIRQAVRRREAAWADALPLWVKLSPNVTDLPSLAATAVESAPRHHPDQYRHGPGPGPGHRPAPAGRRGRRIVGARHPSGRGAGVYECRAALPEVPIVGVAGSVRGGGRGTAGGRRRRCPGRHRHLCGSAVAGPGA